MEVHLPDGATDETMEDVENDFLNEYSLTVVITARCDGADYLTITVMPASSFAAGQVNEVSGLVLGSGTHVVNTSLILSMEPEICETQMTYVLKDAFTGQTYAPNEFTHNLDTLTSSDAGSHVIRIVYMVYPGNSVERTDDTLDYTFTIEDPCEPAYDQDVATWSPNTAALDLDYTLGTSFDIPSLSVELVNTGCCGGSPTYTCPSSAYSFTAECPEA